MAFTDTFNSLRRNRALIIAFAVVLVAIFYFEGLRSFLTLKINDPLAMLILGSAPWVNEAFGWARMPIHWLLMAVEVVVLTWVLARLMPPVFGFLGHAIPSFKGWATMSEKERRRQVILVWVFLGAIASGAFPILLAMILLATYKYQLIAPWALAEIAKWFWPYVCATEVLLQIIPMIVRQQTKGFDVVADQWTSLFPMVGVLVLFILGVGVVFTMEADGWHMWGMSFYAALTELALLALGNQLIAAARGEEAVGR